MDGKFAMRKPNLLPKLLEQGQPEAGSCNKPVRDTKSESGVGCTRHWKYTTVKTVEVDGKQAMKRNCSRNKT